MGVIRKTVTIGDERVELVVEYDYSPGAPEVPPSFSHGGLPPDPAEITLKKVTACGVELLDAKESLSEQALDELYEAIGDQEADSEQEYDFG